MTDRDLDMRELRAALATQQRSIDRLVALLEDRARPTGDVPPAPAAPEPPPPATGPTGHPFPVGPIDWAAISGEERLIAWRELSEFIERLVYRYNLHLEIRPCWWRHTNAIEELTALWHVQQATYKPGAPLSAAMSWADTLHKSRDRLRGIFTPCRDEHIDASMSHRAWMDDGNRAAFFEAVRRDMQEHP